ncbi:MAG: protein XagA [Nocardioidaceae bacterium]|nr:protein XagA [Nocardioidaceae bacterium]
MPCSTRFVCLRIAALAAALLLAAAGAQASAWLEPAGQGQIILGGTFSDSLRSYDVRGRLAPLSSYKKFELTAYTEYGLTDSVTLIAAPSALDFRAKPPGESYAGVGVLEAGGRVKLFEVGETIFSAQATLREASNSRARIFLDTGRGLQADARFLVGRQFTIFGFPAFSSIEVGYRSPGGFGHEVRADLTLGVRPVDKVLVLLQTFNIGAINTAPLYPTRSNKIALSAVYDVTPKVSVQFGGILGLPGVNMTTERGIIAAL